VSDDERLILAGPALLIAIVLVTELLSRWRGASREQAWINGVLSLLLMIGGAIASIYSKGSHMISVGMGLSAPLVGAAFSVSAAARGVRSARIGAGLFLLSLLAMGGLYYFSLRAVGPSSID
jgi:hypothetical protein